MRRTLWSLAIAFAVAGLALAGCGGGKPSTQTLVDRVATGDTKTQAQAAQTLAALLDPAVAAQIDTRARTNATAAAGRSLFRAEVLTIYRLATDAPARRTAAVRSLVRLHDDASTEALVGVLLADSSPVAQQLATDELVQRSPLPVALAEKLVAALDRAPADRLRFARIERVLARGGVPALSTYLLRLPDAAWARAIVAQVGLEALPYLRGELRRGDERTKIAASFGLLELRKRHPAELRPAVSAIVAAMLPQLGSEPQSGAVRVLALVGRPATAAIVAIKRRPYIQVHGVDRHVWEYADVTLADMWAQNHASVADLVGAIARKDYALIAALDTFFVQLGQPGSEPVLIDALNAKGESGMALDFLLSGNAKLAQGGRAWASSHGYTFTGSGTTNSWGAARSRPPTS